MTKDIFYGPDFDLLSKQDPEISAVLLSELKRQQTNLQLIASENFTSRAVLATLGSTLSNKYAEGYPGKRYYGGCEEVDKAEYLAIERAKSLFGADHANVQPHSGASANIAVYQAFTKPGDTVLAMSLSHGGHLTHGSPVGNNPELDRGCRPEHRRRFNNPLLERSRRTAVRLRAGARYRSTCLALFPHGWSGRTVEARRAKPGWPSGQNHPPPPLCEVERRRTHSDGSDRFARLR